MSKTSKAGPADNKSLRAQNAAGIKARFPKAKLLKQFADMAEATGTEADATDAKRKTALMVCGAAFSYRDAAFGEGTGKSIDVSAILDVWREHWRTLIAELHAKQSPFIELGVANKAGEQKPIMSGYGRNVASAARGVIEYAISMENAKGKARTYVEIQKEITIQRRTALPKDKQTLNAAKEALSEASAAMKKVVGSNMEAITLFTSIVYFCENAIKEYGVDGLAAVGLMLDDADLSEWITNEEETEETPADTSDDTSEEIVEEEEVQIAAA